VSSRIAAVPLALAAVLAAAPARAIDSRAGTSGAQFLKIGQGSARAQALGGAYVALAEGSDAMTWNPAGLAATQQREFAFSYLRSVQGLDSPLYLGYAQPMGRTAWGGNFGYLSDSLGSGDVRDANGVPQQASNVNVRDGYVAVGLARSPILRANLRKFFDVAACSGPLAADGSQAAPGIGGHLWVGVRSARVVDNTRRIRERFHARLVKARRCLRDLPHRHAQKRVKRSGDVDLA